MSVPWRELHANVSALKAKGRAHHDEFILLRKDTPQLSIAAITSVSPLSSSSLLSLSLFSTPHSLSQLYICHIPIPPMQLVPSSIPRFPAEMCSSKHFTLAYAKEKWQLQVSDRLRSNRGLDWYWWREVLFLPPPRFFSKHPGLIHNDKLISFI